MTVTMQIATTGPLEGDKIHPRAVARLHTARLGPNSLLRYCISVIQHMADNPLKRPI